MDHSGKIRIPMMSVSVLKFGVRNGRSRFGSETLERVLLLFYSLVSKEKKHHICRD
jgi:hypothetical protein